MQPLATIIKTGPSEESPVSLCTIRAISLVQMQEPEDEAVVNHRDSFGPPQMRRNRRAEC